MPPASSLRLAYSQEKHIARCTAHRNSHRPASPYIGVEGSRNKFAIPLPTRASSSLSSFQQQPSPDLFSDLLFHREQVYGGSSVSSSPVPSSQARRGWPVARIEDTPTAHGNHSQQRPSPITYNHWKEEEYSSSSDVPGMLSHLRAMGPVSNRTRGAREKAAPKKKVSETKSKKRPATTTSESQVKKQRKIEVNSKKKVEGVVNTVPKRASTQNLIVIDSDSEDDTHKLKSSKVASKNEGTWLTPPNQDWDFSKIDSSDTEPDMQPPLAQVDLKNKLARVEAEHATEIQRLRKELEDAKAETESMRKNMQKKLDDVELQHAGAILEANKKFANLERELVREQTRLSFAEDESDQLRVEVETGKSSCNNLIQELEQQRHLNDQAQKDHARALEDLIKVKDSEFAKAASSHQTQLSNLQAENARLAQDNLTLQTDNTRLKQEVEAQTATAAAALASQASTTCTTASSPAPSSACMTDEDIKTDNVRKTYVKVKRRFDNLHAVAVNLSRCTRGMDLTGFGEFGHFVKQLKKALDEGGAERQGLVMARNASRDEVKFGI